MLPIFGRVRSGSSVRVGNFFGEDALEKLIDLPFWSSESR